MRRMASVHGRQHVYRQKDRSDNVQGQEGLITRVHAQSGHSDGPSLVGALYLTSARRNGASNHGNNPQATYRSQCRYAGRATQRRRGFQVGGLCPVMGRHECRSPWRPNYEGYSSGRRSGRDQARPHGIISGNVFGVLPTRPVPTRARDHARDHDRRRAGLTASTRHIDPRRAGHGRGWCRRCHCERRERRQEEGLRFLHRFCPFGSGFVAGLVATTGFQVFFRFSVRGPCVFAFCTARVGGGEFPVRLCRPWGNVARGLGAAGGALGNPFLQKLFMRLSVVYVGGR